MTDRTVLARIDRLILEAIDLGTFEDIFLSVGKNFSGKRPPKFVDLVYRRLMKLRKDGVVSYDKSLRIWREGSAEIVGELEHAPEIHVNEPAVCPF
jgi:hypothetical protein